MIFVVTALIIIGIVQVLCLLALVDQYKGLLQIRERLKLVDASEDLELSGVGIQATAAGLPSALSRTEVAVALMFSTKCLSCFSVAESMKGRLPAGAWAVISGNKAQCTEFQQRAKLTSERVVLDIGGEIVDRLRVHAFPSALLFASGELRAAKSIPSFRELRNILEDWNAETSAPAVALSGENANGH